MVELLNCVKVVFHQLLYSAEICLAYCFDSGKIFARSFIYHFPHFTFTFDEMFHYFGQLMVVAHLMITTLNFQRQVLVDFCFGRRYLTKSYDKKD